MQFWNLRSHFWLQIIRIAETKQNFLDLSDLEDHLKLHQHSGRQLIGCFSAASNVTGILVDDVASTMLLHKYGALAFWDYNLVAPYISINMNYKVTGVEENINVYKDAIYFSGHKFIGGVQTPGKCHFVVSIYLIVCAFFMHLSCIVLFIGVLNVLSVWKGR